MSSTTNEQAAAVARLLAAAIATAAKARASGLHGKLLCHLKTAQQYESAELQAKARAAMPVEQLTQAAEEAEWLSAELGEDPPQRREDALAKAVLEWFKRDFFQWVDAPPCDFCGSQTAAAGTFGPDKVTVEEAAGGAARVEVYRCCRCPGTTRFPRFNDPARLLLTRRGRCGEWANCFTLCCRALGVKARIVYDWTDHVWCGQNLAAALPSQP